MRVRDLIRGDKRRRWPLIAGGVAALAAVAAVVIVIREPSLPPNVGSPARVRLMTGAQFANSIGYVFGPSIDVGKAFAPLQRTDGLLAGGEKIQIVFKTLRRLRRVGDHQDRPR